MAIDPDLTGFEGGFTGEKPNVATFLAPSALTLFQNQYIDSISEEGANEI